MNAGWFPDPGGQPGQRYFDGQRCDEHFAPTPPPSAPAPLPVAIAVSSGGGANHALHAVLTFLSCGLWLPIWILVAVFHRPSSAYVASGGTTAGALPRSNLRPAMIAAALLLGLAAIGTVGLAPPAHADAKQDQDFYRLLTEPDQDHPMVIWNFPLLREQGIEACQREDAGETPYQATKDLQYPNGAYTFDDANSLTSASDTTYCPLHTDSSLPHGGVGMSTPVFPLPIYPPPMYYSPPPPPPREFLNP